MAAPNDTQKAREDLHRIMEDLLAPLPETVRLGGRGPFVINLSATGSPLAMPARPAQGCPQAHLYRVQRVEDGRARYRLRFGPFATEDDADTILKVVRERYPSSLTATADAEDLRLIAAIQAKLPAVAVPPLAIAPTPIAPAAQPAAAAVPTLSTQPPLAAAAVVAARRTTPPAAKRGPQPAAAATQGVGVKLAAMKAASATPASAKPLAEMPVMARKKAVPSAATPPVATRGADTDAVRALAVLELDQDKNWRWFVIQLSVSEQPVDPAAVPKLDIFDVYRLYSVAGIIDGRIVHALRVGFFAEEPAAAAVAGYLATFYDKPAIKRVSAAERDRFAEKSLEPRKDMGATGKQAVIEITNERFVRPARGGEAAAK